MKIGYFFIVCLLVVSLSVKSNVVDDLKNWWKSLTEERKQKLRESVQEETHKTYTPHYIWEYISKPQVDQAYDYLSKRADEDFGKITSKIKTGAAITVGVAAVTGVTYGLYRWLVRRGLGGLIKDFKAIDANFAAAMQEIDKKTLVLKTKKILTPSEKELARGLSMLIKSKITTFPGLLQQLVDRGQALQKIVAPEKNKINYKESVVSMLSPVPPVHQNLLKEQITPPAPLVLPQKENFPQNESIQKRKDE